MTKMTQLISLVCAAALSMAAVPPSYAAGENELEAAHQPASEYRYSDAFADFRIAGELGNVAAQRSAGLMLLYGDALYGPEIHADRTEALRWLIFAAKGGCEVSTHMVRSLPSMIGRSPL